MAPLTLPTNHALRSVSGMQDSLALSKREDPEQWQEEEVDMPSILELCLLVPLEGLLVLA